MFKRTHKRSFEVFGRSLRLFELGSNITGSVTLGGDVLSWILGLFQVFAVGLVYLELVGWVVVLAWGCWSRDLLPISMGTRESREVGE